MISKTKAYKTSDGQTFEKPEEAQVHEVALLLWDQESTTDVHPELFEELSKTATRIVSHRDQILDILTLNSKSRLGARKLHGGKRTKRKKPQDELPKIKKNDQEVGGPVKLPALTEEPKKESKVVSDRGKVQVA